MSWFEKPVALRTGIKAMNVKDHLAFAFGLLFSLVLLTSLALGQPKNAAPTPAPTLLNGEAADWQAYRANNSNISAVFPKRPVWGETEDRCNELATESMTAYSDEVVYEINIFSRGREENKFNCASISFFGASSFKKSLARRGRDGATIVSEVERGQMQTKELKWEGSGSTRITYVLYDTKTHAWVEATMTFRDAAKVKENEFVSSVKLDGSIGTKINKGNTAIIGDILTANKETPSEEKKPAAPASPPKQMGTPSKAPNPDLMVVITRPKPGYTDLARRRIEQGKVVLRATFQANGMVGNIEVKESLKFGLTEAAIDAARKMAFLPARRNGVPVSTIKTIEYAFYIY